MGKTAVDYDLDLLRCPLRDQNKESTFLFLYPPVLVHSGCCNQKTKQIPSHKGALQTAEIHCSQFWRLEVRDQRPCSRSDLRFLAASSHGGRG